MDRSPPSARGRRILALPLALALLWAASGSALGGKKNRPFHLAPTGGEDSPLGPGVRRITVIESGLEAEITPVTGYVRRRLVAATLDLEEDPFAAPPGGPERYTTFLVALSNRTGRRLRLNPATARILTNKGRPFFAMDYTYLREGLRGKLTLEQTQQIAYERELLLEDGGQVRKLLVFGPITGDWKQCVLDLSFETDGLASLDLSAPFEKVFLDGKP